MAGRSSIHLLTLMASFSSDDLIENARFSPESLDRLEGWPDEFEAESAIDMLDIEDSSDLVSQMLNGGSWAWTAAWALAFRDSFKLIVCRIDTAWYFGSGLWDPYRVAPLNPYGETTAVAYGLLVNQLTW